ncbi:MAG: hypothetical protein ACRD44_11410, partial [Bryobacteraceae bacterium]
MTDTSADLLEFPALRDLVGRWVASPPGRKALAAVAPADDRDFLEAALEETAEAIAYVRDASRPQPAARGSAIALSFGSVPET